ncbi:MAG: GNAT family N-acetyltransferase [Pseudomonadales bacterium]
MNFTISEASAKLPNEPYLTLLLLSAFPRPRDEQIRIGQEFHDSPSHLFWVASVEQHPIGGCAVIESGPDLAIVRYMGVEDRLRNQGVGRQLLEVAIRSTSKHTIQAETGDDAKDFYGKCGFSVLSLGEKYPGVIRYVCTYSKSRAAKPRR